MRSHAFKRRRLAEVQALLRKRDEEERARVDEDVRRFEIAAAVSMAHIAPEHYPEEQLREKLAALGVAYEDIERIVADLPWWKDYFCDTPRCGFYHGGELGELRG